MFLKCIYVYQTIFWIISFRQTTDSRKFPTQHLRVAGPKACHGVKTTVTLTERTDKLFRTKPIRIWTKLGVQIDGRCPARGDARAMTLRDAMSSYEQHNCVEKKPSVDWKRGVAPMTLSNEFLSPPLAHYFGRRFV